MCVFFSLSLQYSEKALYNQLCFYRFIFDWDHAVSKVLLGEEKSKTAHTRHHLPPGFPPNAKQSSPVCFKIRRFNQKRKCVDFKSTTFFPPAVFLLLFCCSAFSKQKSTYSSRRRGPNFDVLTMFPQKYTQTIKLAINGST